VAAGGASMAAGGVAAGASGGGDLSPQADRASAHAAVNMAILRFMQRLLGGNGDMVPQTTLHHVKNELRLTGYAPTGSVPLTRMSHAPWRPLGPGSGR